MRVIAMCGLAFSGKSTIARLIAGRLGFVLISLDAINEERGLDGGSGLAVEQWEETSHIAMKRLRSSLSLGRSTVVDDTFSHRMLRERCKGVAEQCHASFTILFVDTPLPVIQARRMANDVRHDRPGIEDRVFESHRAGFQVPTPDEPVVRIASEQDLHIWMAGQTSVLPT